jgi:ADP-heptose:LPS heptosyltransferase
MDMSAGEFSGRVAQMGSTTGFNGAKFPLVNAVDGTTIRVLMALISRATGVVALDSAPLYMAQALNVPAVSLWGTHAPGARIGYDKPYMDLAIWNPDACRRAPCFAYSQFPVDKCPNGAKQRVCEVLNAVDPQVVLAKADLIEASQVSPFKKIEPQDKT